MDVNALPKAPTGVVAYVSPSATGRPTGSRTIAKRPGRLVMAGLATVVLLASCTADTQNRARPAAAATQAAASTSDAPVPRASPITTTTAPVTPAPTSATSTRAGARAVLLPPVVVDYADPRAVADAYTRARGRYTWTDAAGYVRAQGASELATPSLTRRSTPDPSAVDRLVTAQETSGVIKVATTPAAAPSGQPAANDATTYVTCTFTTSVTYRGAAEPDVEDQVWTLRLQRGAGTGWRVDAVTAAAAADPVEDD